MDTTALLNAIRDLGIAALPFIVAWIGKHIHNTVLQNLVDDAVKRAGGIAYSYLVARSKGMSASAAQSQAISAGVDYLKSAVPTTLTKLGVNGTFLRDMVEGELGKLLAVDPNTVPNVPQPVPVTPPAPMPEPPKVSVSMPPTAP